MGIVINETGGNAFLHFIFGNNFFFLYKLETLRSDFKNKADLSEKSRPDKSVGREKNVNVILSLEFGFKFFFGKGRELFMLSTFPREK